MKNTAFYLFFCLFFVANFVSAQCNLTINAENTNFCNNKINFVLSDYQNNGDAIYKVNFGDGSGVLEFTSAELDNMSGKPAEHTYNSASCLQTGEVFTFRVTVVGGTCGFLEFSKTVKIAQKPTAKITSKNKYESLQNYNSTNYVCLGEFITVTNSSTSGYNPDCSSTTTYILQDDNGFTSVNINDTKSYQYFSSAERNIEIWAFNECNPSATDFSIAKLKIIATPFPSFSDLGTISVCSNVSKEIGVSVTNQNYMNYTWTAVGTVPAILSHTDQSKAQASIIFTSTGTYQYTLKAKSFGGCSLEKILTFNVEEASISFSTASLGGSQVGNEISVCPNENFTLYAFHTGSNGSWYIANLLKKSDSKEYQINPDDIDNINGTKVKYQLPSGCFKEITVKKHPSITPEIKLTNNIFCNIDQEHPFSAIPAGGIWSGGAGIVDANTGKFNFNNVAAGNYVLNYQVQSNGCNFFASATIQIIDNATIQIQNTEEWFCTDKSITLEATPVGGSFDLAPQSLAFATIQNGNILTSTTQNNAFVTVLYKYGSNCITQKVFEIYPLPQITFNQLAGSTLMPLNDKTTFDARQQLCENVILVLVTANVNGSWKIIKDNDTANAKNIPETGSVFFGGDGDSFTINNSGKMLYVFTTVSHTLRNYELIFNATSENACEDKKSIFLQFNPLPEIKGIEPNRVVCKAPITFKPEKKAINGTTGTWSGVGVKDASTGVFDFSTVTAGEYAITYNATNQTTNCSFSHTEKIRVKDFEIVTAGADQKICSQNPALSSPNPIKLEGHTKTNGQVSFSVKQGEVKSLGANEFEYYPPLTFVPLRVELKYEHNGGENCTQTKTKFITVHPAPQLVPTETQQNLSFSGKSLVVCAGRNITISANPTENATINKLFVSLNGVEKELDIPIPTTLFSGVKFSNDANKQTVFISIAESFQTQKYYLRYDLTSSLQNCTYTDFLTVEVLGIPEITFENKQDTYCKNNKDVSLSVNVKINGTDAIAENGTGTWKWTGNASDFIAYSEVPEGFAKYATFNFKNATVGTHDLIYEYSTNPSECTAILVKKITIKEPQAIEAGNNQEVCINDFLTVSYVLPVELGNGFYTVTADQQNLNAISLENNIFKATKAGTYKIDLVYDYNTVNCEVRDSKFITVHPLPTLSFISTNAQINKLGDYQICRGGEIPSFKVEENVVRWYEKKNSTWVQFLTTATFTPSNIDTTIPKNYEWGVSFQNPTTKCFSEIQTISLKIPENFVKLTNQTVCQEDQVVLDPTQGNKNFKYIWTNENKETLSTDSTYKFIAASAITLSSTVSQKIFVEVTNDKGCTDTASIVLTIIPKIRNNQITAPEILCSNKTLIVKAPTNLVGGNGFYTVTWQYSFESSTQWYDVGKDTPFKVNNQSDNSIEPVITQTTFFRRKVESSICLSFSNTTKVRYIKTPTITKTVNGKEIPKNINVVSKCYGEKLKIGISVDTDNTNYYVYKSTESATNNDIEGGDLTRINDLVGTNISFIEVDMNQGYEYYKVIATREGCSEQIWFRVDAIEIQQDKLQSSYSFCPKEKISIVFPEKTNRKGEKYEEFVWEYKSEDSWAKAENANENTLLIDNKTGTYRVGVRLRDCIAYDEFVVFQAPSYQAEILDKKGDIFAGCNTNTVRVYPKIHKINPSEKIAYDWFRVDKVGEKYTNAVLAAGRQADNSLLTSLQGWFMLKVTTTWGNKSCETYDYVQIGRALAPKVENLENIAEKLCLDDNLNITLKGSFQNNGLLQIIRNGKDTVYNASQDYNFNPKLLGRGDYEVTYKVINNFCNYAPVSKKFTISGLNADFRLKDNTLELVADDSIKEITWQAREPLKEWVSIGGQTTKITLDDKDKKKYIAYRAFVTGRTCKAKDFYFNYLLVGTEKTALFQKFELYPNPVSETLKLSLHTKNTQTISLVLQSIEGKELVRDDFSNVKNIDNYSIDVRNLANGTYILRVEMANAVVFQKFIIQH